MRNIFNIFVIAVVWCMCAFVPVVADDEEDKNIPEYKLKIAFTYNFLNFVDWPTDSAPKKTNTANVCIIGDKEFSNYFSDFLKLHKQELAEKNKIAVNIINSVAGNDVGTCHILFIGKAEAGNVSSIIAHAKHHPVLSISETKDFAENGGVIELARVGKNVGLFSKDKIGLRINIRAAEAANLNIDARLLDIAAEVIK